VTLAVGWLRRQILGISPKEVSFVRRGFRGGNDETRQRLEQIGTTFLQGYDAALEENEPEALAAQLNGIEADLRGFAFEGAAMSLALQDHLLPWKRDRWRSFLQGPAVVHAYMVHVGLGWALARIPWRRRRFERALRRLDPLLGWLAVDGYGFHEGYFSWPQSIQRQVIPKRLSPSARRVFDQGLGRSLWFVNGADVGLIPRTIEAFPPWRRGDLWSGVGLACTYAGGSEEAALKVLRQASGTHQAQVAQGAAFAAKTRQRAGNPAAHTELACTILCRLSAREAAALTDATLEFLPTEGPEPAYESWRRRLQAHFSQRVCTFEPRIEHHERR
jgi:hypothetical protein